MQIIHHLHERAAGDFFPGNERERLVNLNQLPKLLKRAF